MKQFEYDQKKKQLEQVERLREEIEKEWKILLERGKECYITGNTDESNKVYQDSGFNDSDKAMDKAWQVMAERAYDLKKELGLL